MGIGLQYEKNRAHLTFTDHIEADSREAQGNQCSIALDDKYAIVDLDGSLAVNELFMGATLLFLPDNLSSSNVSDADPDIISPLAKWMTSTSANVDTSRSCERYAPLSRMWAEQKSASSANPAAVASRHRGAMHMCE